MSMLRRFEGHRYVGTRDTMIVYDTGDPDQRDALDSRIEAADLFDANLLQTFGPDTLAEARNRGFRPA